MTDYQVEPKVWEGKLEKLNSNTTGIYVFPQPGSTRVRILLSPERKPEEFYQPVIRMFQGKTRTQFMMPVIEYEDETWSDVKYLVCAKTVMQGILTILAGGEYDLLDPEIAHGIVINRTGQGLQTEYNVIPSKNPIPVTMEQYSFETPLTEVAQALEASDREGEVGGGGGGLDRREAYVDVGGLDRDDIPF